MTIRAVLGVAFAMFLMAAPESFAQSDPIAQARSMIEAERYGEALAYAQERARSHPDDHRAHYYVAMAYLGSRQFEAAAVAARRALAVAPEDAQPTVQRLLDTIARERAGIPSQVTLLAGDTFKDCTSCPQMIVVPEGSFMMGSPSTEAGRGTDESPRHNVTFAQPFAIGQYEVTFEEYDACVQARACPAATPNQYQADVIQPDMGWGRGRRPVINVAWNDTQAYTAWLSRQTGQRYRLPSEAEWEYVARAGTSTRYSVGDAITVDDANFKDNGQNRSVPVGSYSPNGYGVADMHGNVWEWVHDCYDTGYFGVPADGSASARSDCTSRVIRGASYGNLADELRSANRLGFEVTLRGSVGFRVARSL